jgi:hypothetical protein
VTILKIKNYNISILFLSLILMSSGINLFARGTGSRAAFTRNAWVAGAKYAAMGSTGVVTSDDVYSIYWNPAGLTELKIKSRLTDEFINDKAKSGDIDKIDEKELLNFSETTEDRSFFQMGVSGGMLDVERNAGFAGMATNFFNGVLGVGVLSVTSTGIEERDESGNLLSENLSYVSSVSYISYAWSNDLSSIGISVKGLYERIDDVVYGGGGVDIGTQVDLLPFLKVAFMASDLGSGLTKISSEDDIESGYDFAAPALKLGLSFRSDDSGVTFAFSGVKKLEQDDVEIHIGFMYEIVRATEFYLGMSDTDFTTGVSLRLGSFNFSYAFIIDKINNGYNNVASVEMLF